jgi:hypothetical protein
VSIIVSAKILLPVSLLCGFVGGVLGHWVVPGSKTATFETVQVTRELIVTPKGQPEQGCRLVADGTVTATGGLIGNQIRGNLIVGRSLMASLNATQQTLDNQLIVAEISANPARGGTLVLRNQNGIYCPSRGKATQGYETFMGFDGERGVPAFYIQDIAQGPQGRAFFVCTKPQPPTQQQAQKTSPQQGDVRTGALPSQPQQPLR